MVWFSRQAVCGTPLTRHLLLRSLRAGPFLAEPDGLVFREGYPKLRENAMQSRGCPFIHRLPRRQYDLPAPRMALNGQFPKWMLQLYVEKNDGVWLEFRRKLRHGGHGGIGGGAFAQHQPWTRQSALSKQRLANLADAFRTAADPKYGDLISRGNQRKQN